MSMTARIRSRGGSRCHSRYSAALIASRLSYFVMRLSIRDTLPRSKCVRVARRPRVLRRLFFVQYIGAQLGATAPQQRVRRGAGGPGQLRGDGRGPPRRQLLREQIHRTAQELLVDTGRGRRGAVHHKRHLTAFKVVLGLRACQQLAQRAAVDGLVRLGELARDDRLTVAAELRRHVSEHRDDAMRGFEKNQRAGLACESGERLAPLVRARRQKALETESV